MRQKGREQLRTQGDLGLDDALSAPCLSTPRLISWTRSGEVVRDEQSTYLNQVSDDKANTFFGSFSLSLIEQVECQTENEKVGKERVEVTFERKMDDVGEVRMIQVSEDAEELSVEVSRSGRESR